MRILVTGGAGYIGSHTCVELLEAGYDVVVLDNLSNSSEKSLERVEKITGKKVTFYKADILDKDALNKIFDAEKIDAVIHFAGLKAVGESVAKPWEYYQNNIAGTLVLVDVMRQHNCKNIIFSSSATVYGDPEVLPITEDCKVGGTTNPYGTSKLMIERILKDINISNPKFLDFTYSLAMSTVSRTPSVAFIIINSGMTFTLSFGIPYFLLTAASNELSFSLL